MVMSEHFERTWNSREAFTSYVTQGRDEMREESPDNEAAVAKMAESRWEHNIRRQARSFDRFGFRA